MTDKFELAAAAVAKGLVETIPGGSVITNLISALTTGNDENFQQQLPQKALDATLELKRRIDLVEEQLKKQGKKLEELGALRTRKCFADFAAAYAESGGDAKREALLNVAARQFDSSLQNSTLRTYWFGVVRGANGHGDLRSPRTAKSGENCGPCRAQPNGPASARPSRLGEASADEIHPLLARVVPAQA